MDLQEEANAVQCKNPSVTLPKVVDLRARPLVNATDVQLDSHQSKRGQVLKACNEGNRRDLVSMATSPLGLVDDEVRQKAWPLLLSIPEVSTEKSEGDPSWRTLLAHKDEDQVRLDVNRSFVYYPKHETDARLSVLKAALLDLIVQVLREHPTLSYFQGYHDIVQVFLLVLGSQQAAKAVEYVSLLRIRDFMLPTLDPSLAHLQLLPAILSAVDPGLCRHISTIKPNFALAATLTLFAHNIQEYADVARLFDFFLAQPAVMSIYIFAAIILQRKEELLEIPVEDFDILHVVLQRLPERLDVEALIAQTMSLYRKHPPERLPGGAWRRLSQYSVLKTTTDPTTPQSLADAELCLNKQVAQVRREETKKRLLTRSWQLRRPLGGIALAVAVGIVAFWLQRNGASNGTTLGIQRTLGFFKLYKRP